MSTGDRPARNGPQRVKHLGRGLILCLLLAAALCITGGSGLGGATWWSSGAVEATQPAGGESAVGTFSGASLSAAHGAAVDDLDTVIITFKDDVPSAHRDQVLAQYQLMPVRQLLTGALLARAPPRGPPMPVLLAVLREEPTVAHAEANAPLRTVATPNDPHFHEQWGLHPIAGIQAVEAWEAVHDFLAGAPPQAVVVAVVDTGVDASHPDLHDRLLPGRNVIHNAEEPEDPDDDASSGHGTRVAGIIAAATDNSTGIAGVAGTFPVAVLPIKALTDTGEGTVADVADGVMWAADWQGPAGERVQVINLSLGEFFDDPPQDMAHAVAYAQEQGIVVVAAAGQEGGHVDDFYPAAHDGVVSVKAVNPTWHPIDQSNTGADLRAPGQGILATVPGNAYSAGTGSSFAAPFVSGTAALMFTAATGVEANDISSILTSEGVQRSGTGARANRFLLSAIHAITALLEDIQGPLLALPASTPDDVVALAWQPAQQAEIAEYHRLYHLDLDISLAADDGQGGEVLSLPEPVSLTLDLSSWSLAAIDAERLGLYRYDPSSDSWLYLRGHFDLESGELRSVVHHTGRVALLESQVTFADISDHWARTEIEILAGRQLVLGRDVDLFAPEDSVTRAEFAALLVRALDLTAAGNDEAVAFFDVAEDAWYREVVEIAYEHGIIKGITEDLFAPEQTISRQELAVMVHRALKHEELAEDLPPALVERYLFPFEDTADIAPWAEMELASAVHAGIVQGRTSTTLVPQGSASRAEATVMLKRFTDLSWP